MEIAAELEPIADLLPRFGLSIDDFRRLAANPTWVAMYQETRERFHSIGNTPERIKLKAQLLTELGLEAMHDILQDDSAPPAARVSAYRAATALTGLEKPETAKPGTRFILNINLPDRPTETVIEGELVDSGATGRGALVAADNRGELAASAELLADARPA